MFVEAPIDVAVIDVPGPVKNLVVAEVIGNSAQVSWDKPEKDGNCEIIGYKIEKRDKRSGKNCEWFLVQEKVRQTKFMVYGLVAGNEYEFRVHAINDCGLGHEAVTPGYADIPNDELDLKTRSFNAPDTQKPPKFTSPLNERMMVVNYEANLSCSLQGNPRPKVGEYFSSMNFCNNKKLHYFKIFFLTIKFEFFYNEIF